MATLFLKYRPKTFTDLVGQEPIVRTLQNALKTENPSHAYLFCGSRGTGKTSSARIFAKGLNCGEIKDGNPCGTCKTCTDIAEGHLIDIIEIDAASHTSVENIRNIIDKMEFTPTYAKRKVYIIDEVHMLSKSAFNALLKTLEEPPEHVYFLLATTEFQKIPETIISRCQTFIFHRFSLEQLVKRLGDICKTENFSTTPQALQIIARKAEGGLRDAISLLEQIAAETENNITEQSVRESLGISSSETLENFWNAIGNKDLESGFQILKKINEEGGDFRSFGHDFLSFLREHLHKNLNNPAELETILSSIEEIETALARLKTSPIMELPLEIALVNICTQKNNNIPPLTKGRLGGVSSTNTKTEPTKLSVQTSPQKPEAAPISDQDSYKPSQSNKETASKTSSENPPPKNNEVQSSNTEELLNFSTDVLKNKMKDIADRAQIPIFAKRSFLTTVPKIDGGMIDFLTDSEFHRDKLISPAIQGAIQKAIQDLFQTETSIKFTKGSIQRTQKSVKKEEKVSIDDFLSF